MTDTAAFSKELLGWREWIGLPELGIPAIKAKIDTGARTSALHAFFVEPYQNGDESFVRFGIHPYQDETETEIVCDGRVIDERSVTDSGGHVEKRFVIGTQVVIGTHRQRIEVTLTNRDTMKFRMLLGRTAITDFYRVDPAVSYLMGKPKLTE